jgi:hypothetical protein
MQLVQIHDGWKAWPHATARIVKTPGSFNAEANEDCTMVNQEQMNACGRKIMAG